MVKFKMKLNCEIEGEISLQAVLLVAKLLMQLVGMVSTFF